MGVPAHAHPLVAPGGWDALARPGAPVHWVALDVAGGPGARSDPQYVRAAARLRAAGTRVLGTLDTRGGTRPFGELLRDAQHFIDWYRVGGYHLDHVPADRAGLAGCRRLTRTLAELLADVGEHADGGHLVLDHGTHPDPDYADLADQLVTFRGPWTVYRWSETPQWTADLPPDRFCHLVHGVPRPHLETALRIARWQGAATVFLTDHGAGPDLDPWDGLPDYWDEVCEKLANGAR